MRSAVLSIHPGLAGSSRLPAVGQEDRPLQVAELMILFGAGVAAAVASAFLDFSLGVPGHKIILVVLPMSLGLALTPRRMAGSVMGLSALGSAMFLKVGAFGTIGPGAMTSLTLTGPLMDLALWRVRRGWGLYLGCALAGLGANWAALAARAGVKWIGFDRAVTKPLAMWLPKAAVTYTVCGIAAGLISALIWFQLTADKEDGPSSEPVR
jgi:ABC-type Co2+ transport system permease subunit